MNHKTKHLSRLEKLLKQTVNPKLLKAFAKIFISALALYFVFTKIPFRDVWFQIKDANVFLMISALVLFVLSKILASFRLLLYFKAIGIKLDSITNLKLYLLGMFYNLFLPGGIGGDGYKIYLLKKQEYSNVRRLLGSVLVDRLSGLYALFCLLIITFVFCSFYIPCKQAVLILIPISYFAYQHFIKYIFPYLKTTTKASTLYSFIVQALQMTMAFFLLLALGQNANIPGYLFLFLVSSVVAALPLTIGGVGGREITALIGADLLHLNIDIAIALSLCFYLITALVSLSGIYYMIIPFETQLYANKLSLNCTNSHESE